MVSVRASSTSTPKCNEGEIARFAEFGKDVRIRTAGSERGPQRREITTYMNATTSSAPATARWYYPLLMKFEWPVLLKIMGKGEGEGRYLGVAEVRTLFNERRLPDRINRGSAAGGKRRPRRPVVRMRSRLRFAVRRGLAAIVAVAEFPNQVGKLRAAAALLLPPPLPERPGDKAARLARPELVDRGPALVPSCQPGHRDLPGALWLVRGAGAAGPSSFHSSRACVKDSAYLERFGFIPSPKTIRTDADDTAPLRLRQHL